MSFDGVGYLQDFPEFIEKGTPPCAQADPDIFFPVDAVEGGSSANAEYYADEQGAKNICDSCPYKLACLSFALEHPDSQGIWGGATQMDRRRMLRRIRAKLRAGVL